jgi:transaldolase
VADAYLNGLEKLAANGGRVSEVASVASFFVSRIDAMVDALIEDRLRQVGRASARLALRALTGQVAVANAKLAYASYREICVGERWQKLAARGARTQRLLWASTSVKNPTYRDVLYVEELIGADTVNTMPEVTLNAFRDHGVVRPTLEEGLEQARDVLEGLEELGISMRQVTDQLQVDAVDLFVKPFDQLLGAIEAQREAGPRRAYG